MVVNFEAFNRVVMLLLLICALFDWEILDLDFVFVDVY